MPPTAEMERAYLKRDASYNGLFFLGVRTTGIFCRPTCPARKPLPKNVEYFPTAQAALVAGYRPCKRCRPLESDDEPQWASELLAEVERDPDDANQFLNPPRQLQKGLDWFLSAGDDGQLIFLDDRQLLSVDFESRTADRMIEAEIVSMDWMDSRISERGVTSSSENAIFAARTRAESTGILRRQKMANTMRAHRVGLPNWDFYPISTGPLEGTNTKIRVLQRQAYGFRDGELFRLKIDQLHETQHAFVG